LSTIVDDPISDRAKPFLEDGGEDTVGSPASASRLINAENMGNDQGAEGHRQEEDAEEDHDGYHQEELVADLDGEVYVGGRLCPT